MEQAKERFIQRIPGQPEVNKKRGKKSRGGGGGGGAGFDFFS